VYGNSNEIHLSSPDKKFFKKRGYLTKVVKRGSSVIDHLTAVKELKNGD
jgi:hypothetical protein